MSEKYAKIHWVGRRKGAKPHHLILRRSDGSVLEGDASFCGMVIVGDSHWEVDEEGDNRACKRCVYFAERYERRRGVWR
jgi:hypothetical protein